MRPELRVNGKKSLMSCVLVQENTVPPRAASGSGGPPRRAAGFARASSRQAVDGMPVGRRGHTCTVSAVSLLVPRSSVRRTAHWNHDWKNS
jgi:hypothetical protein